MAARNLDRPESKRPRQGSDDTNTSAEMCQRCEYVADKTIACSGCKLIFCTECAKISNTLYKCLMEGELSDFHWSCKSCKSSFPTLQNIAGSLEEIQKKHSNRMDGLENRMGNLETFTKKEVENQVNSLKADIIESLKGDISTVVDIRSRELEDRKRRETNLTIFNLKEHSYENGADNKRADEEDILEISSGLGLEKLNITTLFRLGKKDPSKNRPLKVVLLNKSDRKYMIENAKHIQNKTDVKYHRVIIAKDLTPEQRKERRDKIQARRMTQQDMGRPLTGQENTGIYHSPARRVHFPLSEPETVEMQTEDQMPSPIRNDRVSQLSNYIMNASNDYFTAYDQTTVINMSSNDTTLPGGITTQPVSPNHPGQFDV